MVVQIQADGDPPHLVALARGSYLFFFALWFIFFVLISDHWLMTVNKAETVSGNSWHVFNDFLVRAISEEEALSFPSSWKVRPLSALLLTRHPMVY